MKKILLASATALALVAGVGAASAQMSEHRHFGNNYAANGHVAWGSGGSWSEHRSGGMHGHMYGPIDAYGPSAMYGAAYGPAGPTTLGYAGGPGVSVD